MNKIFEFYDMTKRYLCLNNKILRFYHLWNFVLTLMTIGFEATITCREKEILELQNWHTIPCPRLITSHVPHCES